MMLTLTIIADYNNNNDFSTKSYIIMNIHSNGILKNIHGYVKEIFLNKNNIFTE